MSDGKVVSTPDHVRGIARRHSRPSGFAALCSMATETLVGVHFPTVEIAKHIISHLQRKPKFVQF
jgi:hypothetical protein